MYQVKFQSPKVSNGWHIETLPSLSRAKSFARFLHKSYSAQTFICKPTKPMFDGFGNGAIRNEFGRVVWEEI